MNSAHIPPVTVFCVDDQAVFREVVRHVIVATPGLKLVGDASCGREAIRAVAFLRPDIVLVDVWMPGLNGFETARAMTARRRDLVVILTSADPIEPPPEFVPREGQVALVRKQDLCPRVLLDVWHGRSTH